MIRSPRALLASLSLLALVTAAAAQQAPTPPVGGAPPAAGTTAPASPAAEPRKSAENPKRVGAFPAACRNDAQTHCAAVERGTGGRLACLRQNRERLSPDCAAALQQRADAAAGFRQACRADMLTLCGDIPPGKGARLACLREKAPQASPACAEALAKAPAGRQAGRRIIAPKQE